MRSMRGARLQDDAVAVLDEHDVHELRGEVRGEGARKAREQPLRDVEDAGHAVLLQVAREARVVALDEPVEHGHLVLEVAQAVEVEAPQVAAAAVHERAEELERKLLRHVHQQNARHEAHALAVSHLRAPPRPRRDCTSRAQRTRSAHQMCRWPHLDVDHAVRLENVEELLLALA